QVLPASAIPVKLSAEMTDGTVVNGESKISGAYKCIRRIKLEPADVPAVKSAIDAILGDDIVVLGPGSLYTSIIPNLLVREITGALRETKAERMYVCNVMTQPGETDSYTASDHVRALFEHAGPGIVDCVLVNVENIDSCLLDNYARGGACPVEADLSDLELLGVRVIPAQMISETNWVRHDPERLAKIVLATLDRRRNKKYQPENGEKRVDPAMDTDG
ncbi:MAG: Gluconeosis factor, partial [Firmicutes bacterium]|nr:Gluconeosis factor [Bacillota bacterium]